MLLPGATAAVLGNNLSDERVCATSHLRCSAVDTVLNSILRTEQPAKAQARRKRFRETTNAQHAFALRQCIETGRHATLKKEVAVDIILDNQKVMLAG